MTTDVNQQLHEQRRAAMQACGSVRRDDGDEDGNITCAEHPPFHQGEQDQLQIAPGFVSEYSRA